ncbi:hypothetical protein VTN00DRAFT_6073 [Thermoascus crustaceus]|uniref:uncharacterized protein n=1 Tax=Thermoascus crustaceus TaxID=5088 RepID=UPI003742D340
MVPRPASSMILQYGSWGSYVGINRYAAPRPMTVPDSLLGTEAFSTEQHLDRNSSHLRFYFFVLRSFGTDLQMTEVRVRKLSKTCGACKARKVRCTRSDKGDYSSYDNCISRKALCHYSYTKPPRKRKQQLSDAEANDGSCYIRIKLE